MRLWADQFWRWVRGKPLVHCWTGRVDEYGYDTSETCMRLRGHLGRHEYTPDEQIGVTFREGA